MNCLHQQILLHFILYKNHCQRPLYWSCGSPLNGPVNVENKKSHFPTCHFFCSSWYSYERNPVLVFEPERSLEMKLFKESPMCATALCNSCFPHCPPDSLLSPPQLVLGNFALFVCRHRRHSPVAFRGLLPIGVWEQEVLLCPFISVPTCGALYSGFVACLFWSLSGLYSGSFRHYWHGRNTNTALCKLVLKDKRIKHKITAMLAKSSSVKCETPFPLL